MKSANRIINSVEALNKVSNLWILLNQKTNRRVSAYWMCYKIWALHKIFFSVLNKKWHKLQICCATSPSSVVSDHLLELYIITINFVNVNIFLLLRKPAKKIRKR